MTVVYGVFDPGFASGTEPTSMLCDGAAKSFFTRYGVPADWGVPTHAVTWFDNETDQLRGAVANYRNGYAAIVRFWRGRWELTFGEAPQ